MEPTQSGTGGTTRSTSNGSSWLFPALLTVVLLCLIGIAKLLPQPASGQSFDGAVDWAPSELPAGETVALTVDFGNGASKVFAALPWQPGMTVADLMLVGREFRPGIEFTQNGSGASGFLSALDGLANEGAGGRNWIYRVDSKHAHQSFCLEKIEPGMHILWTFTNELYNGEPAEE